MESIELWKTIDPAGYAVSSLGRVSGKRKDFLKPLINVHGYARVCLRFGVIQKYKSIHSLVMGAFIGPRSVGMTINHKDGNKLNNRLDNLEYVTLQDNLAHGWSGGKKRQGDSHGMRKLNSIEVGKIRQLASSGIAKRDLAKTYGVCKSQIVRIVAGRSWIHRSLKGAPKA